MIYPYPHNKVPRISVADKSFPPSSWGNTDSEFAGSGVRLSDFQTPLLTLDESAMLNNETTVGRWAADRGLNMAPHGKTTMAPILWRRLIDAGAWGLTVATGWQAQVARSFGFERILIAGELIDPVGLAWAAGELDDPSVEIFCWADSVDAVQQMRDILRRTPTTRAFPVLVELGGLGGRAGARTIDEALHVVRAIEQAPELRLAGVAGWEGALASDRSEASLFRVRSLLDNLLSLSSKVDWPDAPIVSAGGSAYFDVVAEALQTVAATSTPVLRSGAYQVHDAGHYSHLSPLKHALRSAMHGWSRVISIPEPGLAILDGGKRDFPYDEGLPWTDIGVVTRTNDQHSYLETTRALVGDVVRLELSHPCTAFDKWRCIPVIRELADDPEVIGIVRTYF